MLTTRLTCLLVAGLLLLIAAAPAAAAGPATVTVRVEGAADTLVPRTSVTTTTAPVNKDGVSGHDCTGTSVAGALEVATGGAWTGTWNASFGYEVKGVKGETPAGSEFFALWVNGKSSQVGACGAELQQGDEVLFYVSRCDVGPAPDFACTNPPVQPLSLAVPATANAGEPFGVRVVELADGGAQTPVAGATVSGGDAPTTTGADGIAVVTLSASGTLRATKAGRARSASEAVAVRAADAAPPTIIDVFPPIPLAGRIGSIDEQQRFARGRGPRTLSGDVQASSGVRDVRLRLTRTARGRCETFDGRRERFVRLSRCGAVRGRWFSVGDRAEWSYLLPSRLGRGRYVLDIEVTDASGARDRTLQRGRNRVVFHVA
jgi:hypothetical protein